MDIKKKIIFFLIVLPMVSLLGASSIYAHPMTDFYGDDNFSGWTLFLSHAHQGTKTTYYDYATLAVEEDYETDFDNGRGLWGNLVTMLQVDVGNEGTINAALDYTTTARALTTIYSDVNNHIDLWTLLIYINNFTGSSEGKARTMAHEIGHVYGLNHVSNPDQIMYGYYDEEKDVESGDEWGMKVCTEEHINHSDYTYLSYNDTQHMKICGACNGYYLEEHEWTDANDYVCNLCDHIRSIAVYEDTDGLLKINLDGQVWVVNYDEEGTEHEWSSDPPKFSELHGYASTCTLPNGGTLTWDNSPSGQYNRYFYDYNGQDCYLWADFLDLRADSKVYRNPISWYVVNYLGSYYGYQWYRTTRDYTGIFWARLYKDPANGDYVVIWRGLASEELDSLLTRGGPLYAPELKIPVYYDE